MTITTRPAPNAAPARLNVRKSIDSLSAQELADFRRAVKQALALNDKRGFDYFASCHGVPFDATLEITEPLGALPDDADEITVTVPAFNKNGDSDGVLRFKQLTLLTYT